MHAFLNYSVVHSHHVMHCIAGGTRSITRMQKNSSGVPIVGVASPLDPVRNTWTHNHPSKLCRCSLIESYALICPHIVHSIRRQSIAPFCDYLAPSGGDTGCTFDRSAKSQCNMVQYSSALPNDYQVVHYNIV